ncbi:MAG: hypothetical protein K7J15_03330 [Candidatus Regiella insecticola]|nr:hypothetical protein [Candidatus Regiella insecticola]
MTFYFNNLLEFIEFFLYKIIIIIIIIIISHSYIVYKHIFLNILSSLKF